MTLASIASEDEAMRIVAELLGAGRVAGGGRDGGACGVSAGCPPPRRATRGVVRVRRRGALRRVGARGSRSGCRRVSGIDARAGTATLARLLRACERITLNAKIAKRAKHLFERFFLCGLRGLCVDVISSHPL